MMTEKIDHRRWSKDALLRRAKHKKRETLFVADNLGLFSSVEKCIKREENHQRRLLILMTHKCKLYSFCNC